MCRLESIWERCVWLNHCRHHSCASNSTSSLYVILQNFEFFFLGVCDSVKVSLGIRHTGSSFNSCGRQETKSAQRQLSDLGVKWERAAVCPPSSDTSHTHTHLHTCVWTQRPQLLTLRGCFPALCVKQWYEYCTADSRCYANRQQEGFSPRDYGHSEVQGFLFTIFCRRVYQKWRDDTLVHLLSFKITKECEKKMEILWGMKKKVHLTFFILNFKFKSLE